MSGNADDPGLKTTPSDILKVRRRRRPPNTNVL